MCQDLRFGVSFLPFFAVVVVLEAFRLRLPPSARAAERDERLCSDEGPGAEGSAEELTSAKSVCNGMLTSRGSHRNSEPLLPEAITCSVECMAFTGDIVCSNGSTSCAMI